MTVRRSPRAAVRVASAVLSLLSASAIIVITLAAASWASVPASQTRDPETVRRSAREILAGKDFRRDRSPFAGFFDWLAERLRFTRGPSGGGPGLLGNLLTFALIAGAIVLIVRLLATRQRRMTKPEDRDGLVTTVDQHRSAEDWAEAAEGFERDGRLREAVRARYRELLARLAEDRTIVELVGKTSGELLAELSRASPASAEQFGRVTHMFERAWYGGSDVSEPDLRSFERVSAEVLERSRLAVNA